MKWLFLLLLFIPSIYAENGPPIQLETVKINLSDKSALLRGAKFFATNCMVCHTMKYMAHNKLAQEAGITLDKMPLKDKEWWLGIVPPDMTLAARRRSADWLYTYMLSFYKDPSQPTGYNNLLAKDINMPNVFVGMQGEQVLTPYGENLLAHPGFRKPRYHAVLELISTGSMTTAQFDQTMTDLVNFLVYAADPGRHQRIEIGIWVVVFLVIFFVLTWFLKKVYWKNVSRK